MSIKISELPAATGINNADVFAIVQSGETRQSPFSDISAAIAESALLTVISPSDYTPVPASPSSITMSDTGDLAPGMPIVTVQGATRKRHIIVEVVTNTSITLSGPALGVTAIGTLGHLANSYTSQADLILPGSYLASGVTANLLQQQTKSRFVWRLPPSYLVQASLSHDTPDTGTQPTLNILHRGNDVFATDITMPNATTFVDNGVGVDGPDIAEYGVNWDDLIEVSLKTVSGNGDARDLTVSLTYVTML